MTKRSGQTTPVGQPRDLIVDAFETSRVLQGRANRLLENGRIPDSLETFSGALGQLNMAVKEMQRRLKE